MDKPQRIALWMEMAEQFLDTEVQHELPMLAARCVDAGLSVREARAIWRYEVTPALWWNGYQVAGEWAGWDQAWLAGTVAECSGGWWSGPGLLGDIIYYLRAHLLQRSWRAVEALMPYLYASPEPPQVLAARWRWMAKQYLDFAPTLAEPGELEALRAARKVFDRELAPRLMLGLATHRAARRRLDEALG